MARRMNNAAAVASALLSLTFSALALAQEAAPPAATAPAPIPAAPTSDPHGLAPPPVGDPAPPHPAEPPVAGSLPDFGPASGPAPGATAPTAPAGAPSGFSFGADLGGTLMLSQPQATLFRPGATLSIAAFHSLSSERPALLLGLRLRGSVFTNGDPPADENRADPNLGGIGAALVALRWRPQAAMGEAAAAPGPWLELAAGGGVTGDLVRPMGEVGLGWAFKSGPLLLGPMLRYQHVLQSGDGLDGADAKILILGVDFGLLGKAAPVAPVVEAAAAPAPLPLDSDGDGILDLDDRCPSTPEDIDGFEDNDGCPDDDNDRDGIADALDRCPDQAEVVNGVDDQDGCPDEGIITMIDDRVVLQEEVLFETDKSRVSSSGRRALEAVERLCRQHPEWEYLEVEGHADERGTAEYNQRLSEDRAARVRDVLLELGFADDRVTVKGFGYTRPRAAGRDEESLRLNRRVELVVMSKKPVATPGAPPLPPAKPGGPAPLLPRPRRTAPAAAPEGSSKAASPAPAQSGKPDAASEPKAEPKPNQPTTPKPPARTGRSKSGAFEGVEEGQ
jgi:outer membrane protein OmpA-like peptidoglycan-associated protein